MLDSSRILISTIRWSHTHQATHTSSHLITSHHTSHHIRKFVSFKSIHSGITSHRRAGVGDLGEKEGDSLQHPLHIVNLARPVPEGPCSQTEVCVFYYHLRNLMWSILIGRKEPKRSSSEWWKCQQNSWPTQRPAFPGWMERPNWQILSEYLPFRRFGRRSAGQRTAQLVTYLVCSNVQWRLLWRL